MFRIEKRRTASFLLLYRKVRLKKKNSMEKDAYELVEKTYCVHLAAYIWLRTFVTSSLILSVKYGILNEIEISVTV